MVTSPELDTHFDAVREELERILRSRVFAAAARSRMFLQYVVERSLLHAAPKEYEIAVDVLGRRTDYNPEINATVRVEAGRLRQRLREYYETAAPSGMRIDVPKGGYAAVFTPSEVERQSASKSDEVAGDPGRISGAKDAGSWRFPSYLPLLCAGLLALLLLLLLLLNLAIPFRNRSLQAAGPIRSLAVLPLKDLSGRSEEAYFAEGMTDALTTDLAQTPNLRVASRSSAMQVNSSTMGVRKIAAALDVDAVVEGTVVRSGGRVRITAQLIDARDDRHLWADSFEEKADDVLGLQDTVAREIARQTQAALATSRGAAARRPVSAAAYDAYLRGLYFLHRREVERSVSYLTQATALSPEYPRAHAALAEALASQATLLDAPDPNAGSKARVEAERAIALDPNCGEAYAALSLVEMNYTKDWEAARRDLEKSLALNPNNSLAEMQMSVYLDAMDRPEEAVAHMRRALELDPLSFFMNRHLGSALYFARHYDAALDALRRAAEMAPRQIDLVDGWVSRSYVMKGNFAAATAADLEGLRVSFPEAALQPLRTAYQHAGWKAYQAARARLFAHDGRGPCVQFEIGESDLRLGDLDHAFAAFQRGMDKNCFWGDLLSVNPAMDPARADPRYADLLRRANML